MPLIQVSKTQMRLPDDSTDWQISLPVSCRTDTRFGQTKGGIGSTQCYHQNDEIYNQQLGFVNQEHMQQTTRYSWGLPIPKWFWK